MMTLMEKHTIIKFKQNWLSNRQEAKQLGMNRKAVGKNWNDYHVKASGNGNFDGDKAISKIEKFVQ